MLTQPVVPRQNRRLRASRSAVGERLRNGGPVTGLATDHAAGELAADRGRRSTQGPSNLADTPTRRATTRNLLPLVERQPGDWSRHRIGVGHHAASLAEPPPRDR